MENKSSITTRGYWSGMYRREPRMRLPSSFFVGTRNLQQLLQRHIKARTAFLEIGCAPGKMLAWVANKFDACVSGIDYAETGIEMSKKLFLSLGMEADLRCEDLFDTTFKSGSFDVVYSAGLIEHFDDPSDVVRRHIDLCKPGGISIIAVPNYGGIYGMLQKYLDPENLALHNLKIMNCSKLYSIVPVDSASQIRVYLTGCLNPSILSFGKKLPPFLAGGLFHAMNLMGLLQPFVFAPICPLIVLEIVRKKIDNI